MIKSPVEIAEEIIFFDGNSYFESLIRDITTASISIDLETYIFQNDTLGENITDALVLAAQRGVKVRVLVDSAGTPGWGGGITKKLERAQIETRVFHPFPWRLWHWSRSVIKLPFLIKMLYLIFKINARNHRKVCIIDKKIIYIGSANISKCHLDKKNGGDDWRDTSVKLIQPDITELQAAFESAWEHMPIQERIHGLFVDVNTDSLFRLNNSRHRRRVFYKNLLRRISKCRKRVWITNAYFVPDNFLLRKLIDRAKSGVDVRILLPQKSDVFIMPLASAMFYENLLKAGVRIFEYLPTMLHAKSLILDDWFIVGSSNLNHRSLLHDLEVDVNIRSVPAKKAIEQKFLEDVSQSKEIKFEYWRKRNFFQKLFGKIILYIKYWI